MSSFEVTSVFNFGCVAGKSDVTNDSEIIRNRRACTDLHFAVRVHSRTVPSRKVTIWWGFIGEAAEAGCGRHPALRPGEAIEIKLIAEVLPLTSYPAMKCCCGVHRHSSAGSLRVTIQLLIEIAEFLGHACIDFCPRQFLCNRCPDFGNVAARPRLIKAPKHFGRVDSVGYRYRMRVDLKDFRL